MEFKTGDKLANISLPAIDGSVFESESIMGKPVMLSFFALQVVRFAIYV